MLLFCQAMAAPLTNSIWMACRTHSGPDYNFVGNCYSDLPSLGKTLAEEQQAHMLIGAAESVLWPARRLASRVAIVAHRSANAWDPVCVGSCITADQTEHAMTYTSDQFGHYLALAIHGGVQIDFLDENALLNTTIMAGYGVVFVTEPNLPKAGTSGLAAWVKAGGKLVLSGGAAMADEYNVPDDTLSLLTGCSMLPFPRRLLVAGATALPLATANGSIASASGAKRVSIYGDINGFTKLRAEGSKTLGHFDSGAASAVQSEVGAGSIVQLAWMPGFSYLPNTTQKHDVPNPVTDPESRIPNPVTQFPAAIREFLQGLVADAAPSPVSLTDSFGAAVVGVETVLMSSEAGAVVTVVNWGGVSLSTTLSLTLNLEAAGFDSGGSKLGKVLDASSGNSSITPTLKDGTVTVPIAAVHANFIVFARMGGSDS